MRHTQITTRAFNRCSRTERSSLAPKNAPIDGCWSINGEAAKFAQHGARVTGVVEQGTLPLFLAGGSNGRMLALQLDSRQRLRLHRAHRLARRQASQRAELARGGHPALHRVPVVRRARRLRRLAPLRDDVPIAVLHRAGRVSLFALQFDADGNLLADASREELQSLTSIIRTRSGAASHRRARVPPARREDATKRSPQREIASRSHGARERRC